MKLSQCTAAAGCAQPHAAETSPFHGVGHVLIPALMLLHVDHTVGQEQVLQPSQFSLPGTGRGRGEAGEIFCGLAQAPSNQTPTQACIRFSSAQAAPAQLCQCKPATATHFSCSVMVGRRMMSVSYLGNKWVGQALVRPAPIQAQAVCRQRPSPSTSPAPVQRDARTTGAPGDARRRSLARTLPSSATHSLKCAGIFTVSAAGASFPCAWETQG